MKLSKYLGVALMMSILVVGCKKLDFDKTVTGEALGSFRLSAPANNLDLVLNAATPDEKTVISWSASKPGINSPVTYKWVAALKSTGKLDAPLISIPSDASGSATTLTLTQKQMDDALAAKAIAAGVKTELIWSVQADNGTTTLLSQDVYNITVTRMKDGVTAFALLGPVSSTNSLAIDPNSTTNFLTFNWTKSKPAAGGPAITYQVLFAERKVDGAGNEIPVNWASPLFTIAADNNGADSLLKLTYKRLSDSLNKYGFTDVTQSTSLKWTVVASSGTWNQRSEYTNSLSVLRQIKFYLVGNITGWDIDNPFELITDQKTDRYGKVFYTYFKVPASGAQFLFIKEKGNWGSKYGITGGSGPTYDVGYNTGGDFFINTPGIYRLTIDIEKNKAYIQEKQVGVVGNMQGWNAGAPIYGAYIKRDHFLIIAPSNGSDEFKFHDGPVWDNSTPDNARWWGSLGDITAGGGNLDKDGGGANIVANGAPRTRLIWNGTNGQSLKFERSPATEMRIAGNAIDIPGVNDWDPPTSPQMTYQGNGKWTLTLALKGDKEFKFVGGDAWGAFDYEDNGAASIPGTRNIKWEGGDNFKSPSAAGTYTITLDEHTQTVTIQ